VPFLKQFSSSSQVPDYKTIIKIPMDLQTIKTKLSGHGYSSTEEFTADIRQIFFNCSEYNKPRTKEARAGIRLSAYFETRYGELGLDSSEQRGPKTRRSR
jgi:bromodomain adjacent to zinc finger domain protein 1A